MSPGDVVMRSGDGGATQQGDGGLGPLSDRLSLGVAARLSRYLQVLTQARKMGKETISSQELSEYTHVNSTQIRRDLSTFGKFGKRGVGYNIDGLISEIRKILRTQGQHNIALFGAGRLGLAHLAERLLVALRLDQLLGRLQGLADLGTKRLGEGRTADRERRRKQHGAGGAQQASAT